jgi:hypothetical protein
MYPPFARGDMDAGRDLGAERDMDARENMRGSRTQRGGCRATPPRTGLPARPRNAVARSGDRPQRRRSSRRRPAARRSPRANFHSLEIIPSLPLVFSNLARIIPWQRPG